jgi:hypothetical protein
MSGDASSHEGMKRPSFVPCAARRFVLNYFAQGTQSAPKTPPALIISRSPQRLIQIPLDFLVGSKNNAPRAQMPQISPLTVQRNLFLPL